MTSQQELKLALILSLVLLLVGGICYAKFPVKPPSIPPRKIYQTNNGSVMFDHQAHYSKSGYAIVCGDCHHHHEDDEKDFRACGKCHPKEIQQTVPQSCANCHEPSEAHHPETPEENARTCDECHRIGEDNSRPKACADCHAEDEIEQQEIKMTFPKKADAFHVQCGGCHEQRGKGPAKDACASCHIKKMEG